MTKETTLYRYRVDGQMTLDEAITACKGELEGAIALLYSPQRCLLARLSSGGKLQDASGNNIDSLTSIFEARIFSENYELRWLNRQAGTGNAALISEVALPSLIGCTEIDAQPCEALQQQYLLWGERARNQPPVESWRRLADARIGKLDIPLAQSFEQAQRVYLATCEYLNAVDDYGNVAVIEERLVKLEVA